MSDVIVSPHSWLKLGRGEVWCGDSLAKMKKMRRDTIDLCFTSPPFPLIRKKGYGNHAEVQYIDWLVEFIHEIQRLLKPSGSLVLDLGCCWERGRPVKSVYEMRLALRIIDELKMHLAQEFYWWNPSRLPTPAQWVTIEKKRVKDSVNKLLWFSKTENPKASNQRVLQPYSEDMEKVFAAGRQSRVKRPSGHQPSKHMLVRNKGSIPGNLLAVANTNAHDPYLLYCREHGLKPHPARIPYQIPEFFIRLLTEPNDKVLDPFAGSCTTGAVADQLDRRWICIEANAEFLQTVPGQFQGKRKDAPASRMKAPQTGVYAS